MHSYLGNLGIEERVKVMQENEAREKDFVASQEMRREAAEIAAKREEMERHVTERGRRYVENTGNVPTEATVAAWRDQFAAEKEAEHEAERRRQLDTAAANDGIF